MIPATMVTKDRLEFDPIIPEDERRFYLKAYPNVNLVRERKVHCTVCKMHIGTAPSNESLIRMHPILRVTHCKKCHEFYNSGEFSKGEDGSELYCRWCGQGGEVYCCSNCPFVFCKSCIITNLSRGVVADIEQNENWSCFNCAPKMLWPLRAQHWALMKFIDKQKKAILNSSLTDAEIKTQMVKDRSLCCKVKKSTGYGTDSSEASDISFSKIKQKTGEKRVRKSLSKDDVPNRMSPAMAKKVKPNDEVVCTPDVMSMLEPECQLTVAPNTKTNQQPTASSPKIMSIPQPTKINTPPSLVIRNAQTQQIRAAGPSPLIKKTVVGPRLPATVGGDFTTPVYHTINGYRIDLNSAAQQDTVRLPNGKLIQVKRQGTGPQAVTTITTPSPTSAPARAIHNTIASSFSNQQIVHSSGGHVIRAQLQAPRSITVQNSVPQFQQQTPQQYQHITIRQPNQSIATIRYQGAPTQQVTNIIQNGTVQLLNGASAVTPTGTQVAQVRPLPTFIKQIFPNTPLGLTRTQLQNQICSAMDICQHLMSKVQTLTNSNAYKTARSLTDVKELYIHLSYLLTYAIGRFKGLQDNCISDMRELGFINDANSLENGQLAADKQASDAEEDEITIVEPKTDTITLDSDNEDESSTPVQRNKPVHPSVIKSHNKINSSTTVNSVKTSVVNQNSVVTPTTTTNENNEITTQFDFTNVLACMFDIDLSETGSNGVPQPKKPRKKTTNKPNPTLLKQKEIQERERLENLKKNDAKLKMQVQIPLNKVEEIYQYAKPLVDELKCEKQDEQIEVKICEVESREEKCEQKIDITAKSKAEDGATVIKQEEVVKEVQSNADDKDDAEELLVVVVEDLDTSKEDEDSKNDNEEMDGSVEIIEREELQEPDDPLKNEVPLSDDTANNCKEETSDEKLKESEDGKSKAEKDIEKDKKEDQNGIVATKVCKEKALPPETISEKAKATIEAGPKEEKVEAMDIDIDALETYQSKEPIIVPVGDRTLGNESAGSHSSSKLTCNNTLSSVK